ncbi:hypothetical protein FACS1894199_08850 [Bacteroidia bacterium]|nr:hypothetical protein FACS1894199_08850 [Bacteroidia bacterium]
MNNTSKCWLIANFETVATTILVVLYVLVALFFQGDVTEGVTMGLVYGTYCLIIPGAVVSTPPSFSKTVLIFLLTLGGAVFFLFAENKSALPDWITSLWVVADIVAFGVGFFIARYAHVHFSEVVSRRMLYWNSRVSLFEERWKYALDRFSVAAFYTLYGVASVISLIYMLGNQT